MQAIRTRILPATNTKPQRIKATSCSGISITLSLSAIDGHQTGEPNYHRAAVKAFCEKIGWEGDFAMGGLTNNGDCVAVFVTKETTFTV